MNLGASSAETNPGRSHRCGPKRLRTVRKIWSYLTWLLAIDWTTDLALRRQPHPISAFRLRSLFRSGQQDHDLRCHPEPFPSLYTRSQSPESAPETVHQSRHNGMYCASPPLFAPRGSILPRAAPENAETMKISGSPASPGTPLLCSSGNAPRWQSAQKSPPGQDPKARVESPLTSHLQSQDEIAAAYLTHKGGCLLVQ